MFQPHTIVFNGRLVMLMCHTGADYRDVPWPILLNPMRYSLTLFPGTKQNITVNRSGRLNLHWANFNWWLWKRHWSRP